MGNNLILLAGVAVIVGGVFGALIGGAYYVRIMRAIAAGIVAEFVRYRERMDYTLADPEAGSTISSRKVCKMAFDEAEARKNAEAAK